MYFIFSSS